MAAEKTDSKKKDKSADIVAMVIVGTNTYSPVDSWPEGVKTIDEANAVLKRYGIQRPVILFRKAQ